MADSNRPPEKRTIAPLFTWRSAISESCLKPVERHCLLALSLYMNERGGSAYPGSTRLAHDTGYHVVTVKKALQVATDAGWLHVVKKGGSPVGGLRKATEYVAHTPVDITESDRESETTGSRECSDRESTSRGPVVDGYPITSMNTSENSRLREKADPECPSCLGAGWRYHAVAGREGPCECTKEMAT